MVVTIVHSSMRPVLLFVRSLRIIVLPRLLRFPINTGSNFKSTLWKFTESEFVSIITEIREWTCILKTRHSSHFLLFGPSTRLWCIGFWADHWGFMNQNEIIWLFQDVWPHSDLLRSLGVIVFGFNTHIWTIHSRFHCVHDSLLREKLVQGMATVAGIYHGFHPDFVTSIKYLKCLKTIIPNSFIDAFTNCASWIRSPLKTTKRLIASDFSSLQSHLMDTPSESNQNCPFFLFFFLG
jgi:hypothetical protein